MNPIKIITETLNVTMEELRGGGRKRPLCDARTLLAAALPATQQQMAEVLGCTQVAVCLMRKKHKTLLAIDPGYRAKWEQIQSKLNSNLKNKVA